MVYSGFYRRCFLVATVAILAYLLLAVLAPLKGALGWAVVLAFLLHPLHERLSRRLKGRSMLSAGIITGLTPFLVLAPLSVLGVVFAGQVGELMGYLRGHSFAYPQLLARLQSYPLIGNLLRWWSANFPATASQLQGWITGETQSVLKSAATVGGGLALGLFGTVVGFFMMLFLLFFLLRDGRAILDHLKRLLPLEAARRERLLDYLGRVTRAVVFGSAATALIQGIFVGVGLCTRRLAVAGRLRRTGDDRGPAARRGVRRAGAGDTLSWSERPLGRRGLPGLLDGPAGGGGERGASASHCASGPRLDAGGIHGRRRRGFGLRRAGAHHRPGVAQLRGGAGQVHDRGAGRRHTVKCGPHGSRSQSSIR